jgi:hypothetical protein
MPLVLLIDKAGEAELCLVNFWISLVYRSGHVSEQLKVQQSTELLQNRNERTMWFGIEALGFMWNWM